MKKKIISKKIASPKKSLQKKAANLKKPIKNSDEQYIDLITDLYKAAPIEVYACYYDDTCGASCGSTAGTTYGCC